MVISTAPLSSKLAASIRPAESSTPTLSLIDTADVAPQRSPEWINSAPIAKALELRAQGLLSKPLTLWIESLLELEPLETSLADHPKE